jgi:peptidoglycan/LPS O-acetylase OafA/YrhL
LHYRKEIDGLRAIAILPVIWLHSGLPYISGGFLGVDVFFVISGFLITSILMKEFEAGSFSLIKFYERRARRILPALLVVIIVTSIFVPLINQNPKFIGDYGDSVLSTIFFGSNFYFWQTSGYFGSASELSPMLHTWSLAVEEQYYIFFPLLIMVLFPLGKKALISALILISILSLLVSEWGAVNAPIGNFYLLSSRAWELLAGALAALIYSNGYLANIRTRFSIQLSGGGLVLILMSYILFTPSTLHPTSLTIFPVLGAVLVLLFTEKNNLIGRFLSIRPLSIVGLTSYSLYLWHQPILALMKNSYGIHLAPNKIFIALTLIFVLSYLTWKYVENPFRNKKSFSQNKIFRLAITSILLVSICGLVFKENYHLQQVIYPEGMTRFKQAQDALESNSIYEDNCKYLSNTFDENFTNRFDNCVKRHEKAIFILGGSHGVDLYNAIAMNASNPFIVGVSRGYCRAHEFIGNQKNLPKCQYEDFKLFAKKYAANISYVIYTQTPDRLLIGKSPFHKATIKDVSITSVDEVVSYLTDLKENNFLNVIMIGMLPPIIKHPTQWNYRQPFEKQFSRIVSQNSMNLTESIDSIFASKLEKNGIPYISKIDAFSLNLPSDLIIDGIITYSDKRHISDYGERIFGERLVSNLTNKGYSLFNKTK